MKLNNSIDFRGFLSNNVRSKIHPLIYALLHTIYFLPSRILGESYYNRKFLRRSLRDRTFTSRLLEQSLDKNPLFTVLVDKYEVRKVVSEAIGTQFLPKVFQVHSSADDIDFTSLPIEYVLKTNHGSGGNIIVTNAASRSDFLPRYVLGLPFKSFRIHPENFSQKSAVKVLNYWLRKDFSWFPGKPMPEWGYKKVVRKVLVEEFLPGELGSGPIEYRCWCLNGKICFIRVVKRTTQNNFENANQGLLTVYDRNWNMMKTTEGAQIGEYQTAEPPLPTPPNPSEFIEVVETLATLVTAVRVDMNLNVDSLLFSEMTLYPNSGSTVIAPKSLDEELGKIWGK